MAVRRAHDTLRGSGRRASVIVAATLLLALGAPLSTVHAEESAPAPTTEAAPSEPAPAVPEVTVPEEAPAVTEAAPSVASPEETTTTGETPDIGNTPGETLTPSGDPMADIEMPSMGTGEMGDILPEIPGIIEAVPSPGLPPETAAQNGDPMPTHEDNGAGGSAAATPLAEYTPPAAPEAAPVPPAVTPSEPIVVTAEQGQNVGDAAAPDASGTSNNPSGLLGQVLDMAQNSEEDSASASRGGDMAENSAQAAPAVAGGTAAAPDATRPGDDADSKERSDEASRLTSALGRGESPLGLLGSVGLGASAPDESRAIAANKQGFQHNSAAQSGTRGEITTNSTEAALRGVGLAAAAAIIGLGLNALSRRH